MLPRLARVFLLVLAVALVAPQGASAFSSERGYHPSTLLVTFPAGIDRVARDAVHGRLGASVARTFDDLGIDVVRLPDGLDPRAAVSLYERSPLVAEASLNKVIRSASVPNDSLFGDQWGFHNTGQSVTGSFVRGKDDVDIDGPEGWTVAFGSGSFESSGGKRVAILDTGIDRAHVDLLGKVVACAGATSALGIVVNNACDDDGAHGTHVAGTVAANTNNGIGVAGTAPNAELAIFKFLNAAGVGFLADEIAGIEWAHQTARANVISMSFGSYEPDDGEQKALRDAWNAGILLVAAAGNDFDDTKNYPAYYSEVMSVASVNAADAVSEFSVCNSDVEIAAPGEDIWSTFPGNTYGVISGTSMATPHVAGIGALVMSERGLTAQQTRSAIVNSAEPIASTGGRAACNGIERANLAAALGGSTEPPPPSEPGAIAGTVTQSGKSKSAIAGATVDCGSAGATTTGTDGSYLLSSVPVGTYTCTASASGFHPKSQSVTVSSDSTTVADFALRPQKTSGTSSAKRS
jgi:thermitase